MKKPGIVSALIFTVLIVTACTSVDERYIAREQFDHRARRRHIEPAVTIERSGSSVTVATPWLPGTEIFGLIEQTTVYVTGVRLFANWANGWTEAIFEASGTLQVIPARTEENSEGNSRFVVIVEEPLELWTLEQGGIRYYDTYMLGDDGLIRVRGRVSRLREVARWMREWGGPDSYGSDSRDGRYGPAMVADVRKAVRMEIDTETAPEWLTELYQSESLERDLREAPGMLLALYNLEYVNGKLLNSLTLEMR